MKTATQWLGIEDRQGCEVDITAHEVNDGVARLAVSGEIDLDTAEELHDAIVLTVAAGHAAEVVLDLADVQFCDSTGIGAIVHARNLAAAQDVTVYVINPTGMVHRTLALTGALDSLTRGA